MVESRNSHIDWLPQAFAIPSIIHPSIRPSIPSSSPQPFIHLGKCAAPALPSQSPSATCLVLAIVMLYFPLSPPHNLLATGHEMRLNRLVEALLFSSADGR